MTTLSFFVALAALLIGFQIGRMIVNREIKQAINEVDDFMASDTPIGDALARELNIILSKIDAGERV